MQAINNLGCCQAYMRIGQVIFNLSYRVKKLSCLEMRGVVRTPTISRLLSNQLLCGVGVQTIFGTFSLGIVKRIDLWSIWACNGMRR